MNAITQAALAILLPIAMGSLMFCVSALPSTTCSAQGSLPEQRLPSELDDNGLMRWGSDGTRSALSDALDGFFNGKTGNYGPVVEEARRQRDGKYLVADQVRFPLWSMASTRKPMPDGTVIYQAYIHRDTLLRCFIQANAANEIVAAALTNLASIRKNGKVVGVKPRVYVFHKADAPAVDLASEAMSEMRGFYDRMGEGLSGHKVELVSLELHAN